LKRPEEKRRRCTKPKIPSDLDATELRGSAKKVRLRKFLQLFAQKWGAAVPMTIKASVELDQLCESYMEEGTLPAGVVGGL
jgi:hypothetical protein